MKIKFPALSVLVSVLPDNPDTAASNGPVSYIIGGIIALLIMGYLIYTLIRPEKF